MNYFTLTRTKKRQCFLRIALVTNILPQLRLIANVKIQSLIRDTLRDLVSFAQIEKS